MPEDNSPPNQRAFIVHDLFCTNCEYNLRTLRFDSRCPECGTPISTTLNYTPKKSGLRLGIVIAMILAAFAPWLALFGSVSAVRRNPVPIFFICALVELICSAVWIFCGRCNMSDLRQRTANRIFWLVLVLSLSIMAFYAWIVYFIIYLAP